MSDRQEFKGSLGRRRFGGEPLMFLLSVILLNCSLVRVAAAESRNAYENEVGKWSDLAPRCLEADVDLDAPCCRETAVGVVPEVWHGHCTLKKGGLIVESKGTRVDYVDGRRVLTRGSAVVSHNPYWQGSVTKAFRLEIEGGAQVWTDGTVSVELIGPFEGRLTVEEGLETEFGNRLSADDPMVLAAGDVLVFSLVKHDEAELLAAEPNVVEQDVALDASAYERGAEVNDASMRYEATGCGTQPRGPPDDTEVVLFLLVAAVFGLRRRQRTEPLT